MNSLDKFYTSQEEVNKCLVFWEKHVKVKEHHTIIEPSAGNGAFSNKINNIISFDIQPDPKTDNIIKADFLKLNLDEYVDKKVHFIGNPPFGKASKLVFDFINKITDFKKTKSFSFIIPSTHHRTYYMNKINPYFHLEHEHRVTEFIEFGKPKKVKCVFQIWIRKDEKRNLVAIKEKSNLVSFVSKFNCDFAVGNKYKTGKLFANDFTYLKQNRSSLKFIKIHDEYLKEFLQICLKKNKNLLDVDNYYFIACPNTTNQEIIQRINEIYEILIYYKNK